MSDSAAVVTTATTGVTVAVDIIASTSYQRVKLVDGTPDSTTPIAGTTGIPAAASTGLVVAVKPGVSVTIQQGASVSIQAGVSVSIQSILPTIQTIETLLGTVAVNIVAGAAGGGSVTTTAPGITATGQVMWVVGGQSTTVSPVFVSIIQTSVSVAVVPTVNTVVTVLGTAIVSVVPGVSVTIIGQAVAVSGVVPVTTAASVSVTGLPVWMNPTQSVVVGTISTLLTVVTVLGLQVVTITGVVGATVSAIVPVTTAASVSVSGLPIWLNPTQQVVVSGLAGHSITGSVNIVSQALVSIAGIVAVTTAASVSVSGLPIWLNPTQQVVVSGLAGHSVSMAAGTIATVLTIVAVSGVTAVSVVSSIVTILGTQIVTVAGMLFTTASPAQSSTGILVAYKGNVNIPVVIQISSTIVGSSTTMLMTVYTGATFATTGASFWVVPAGRTFRIMGMQMIAVSSAVLSAAQFVVIVGTAAASVSVVASVGIAACLCYAIQASTTPFAMGGLVADVAAATTVGVGVKGGTSHSIVQAAINGYLF